MCTMFKLANIEENGLDHSYLTTWLSVGWLGQPILHFRLKYFNYYGMDFFTDIHGMNCN